MRFIQAGYHWSHDSEYSNKEVIEKNFGHRFRVLLIRSSCYIQINDGPLQAYGKDTLFMAQSGTQISWGAANGDCFVNDWIDFSAEPQEIMALGMECDLIVPEISHDYADYLAKYINVLAQEHYNHDAFHQIITNANLQIFLVELTRYINSNNSYSVKQNYGHAYYSKIIKMREQLLGNQSEKLSLSDICLQNYISESHFRRLYKEIFYTTINKDIIARRITFAQQLLRDTRNYSVVQISDMLGYKCHEHFFRQFKKETGMTPVEYRQRFVDYQEK